MTMEQWVSALAQHGGFALLAGAAIYVCYRMGNLRAQDLGMALEREREARKTTEELHRSTLLTLTSLVGEMQGLKISVTGLLEDARAGRLDDTWTSRDRRTQRGGPG
jgi:hypothetical protein